MKVKDRRFGYLVLLLNLAAIFLGGVCALVAGILVRWLVEGALGRALATFTEVSLAVTTLLFMMIGSIVVVALEKRFRSSGEGVETLIGTLDTDVQRLRRVISLGLRELGLSDMPRGIPLDLYLRHAVPLVEKCRRVIAAVLIGTRSFSRCDYYPSARQTIARLKPQSEIRAVCADLLWELPEALRYFEANVEAAKRGLAVTRIFILPEGDLPSELERCMREHYDAGAEVLVLRRESPLFEHVPELFLPPGVGFVCLSSGGRTEVRVHFPEIEGRVFGKLYTDREPEVVDTFVRWFEELRQLAESYEPCPPRGLHQRVRVELAQVLS